MSLKSALLITCLATFASSAAFAKKPPTISLTCGQVPNIKSEAERQYLDKASGGGDIYNVNLTFVSKKPSNKQIDNALRECLAVAVKKDGTKDVLASAWYRPREGTNPNLDDKISPYNGLDFLSYTAATKSIAVRPLILKKK